MDDKVIRGEVTTVDLGNVAPLMLPWTADPFGRLRPPLSVEAMRLSAELSACVYTMSVDRWLQAGWRDATIQVDGALTRGLGGEDGWLRSRWRLHKVRAQMRQLNPLDQLRGAFRQKERSDTGKALVMIHPAQDGRYVVAISFMGTGSRFYDWFSNFRMTSQDGLHKGFVQLTEQFERNEEDVLFPETARDLGLETLNLGQIIQEAKYPGSRFVLWLSGHSQGAALMQVYALRKLREDGVHPQNLVGYGFASPSVAAGDAVHDPAAFPLYHLLNSDDPVPRMGALVHLGMCLEYPADDALRTKCYRWPQDAEHQRARDAVLPLVQRMTDTPRCIAIAVALLTVLAGRGAEEWQAALAALEIRLPVKPLLTVTDTRPERMARHVIRRLEAAHVSITGKVLSRMLVAQLADEINALMADMGVRKFTETLMQLMAQPHSIQARHDGLSPYMYLVLEGAQRLQPFQWLSGRPPHKVWASRLLGAGDGQATLIVRRKAAAARRPAPVPKRHASRPMRDTRHHAPLLEPDSMRPGEKLVRPD